MDKATLKYYRTIGLVQQAVNKSTTLDEALHEGLGVILDCAGADCKPEVLIRSLTRSSRALNTTAAGPRPN